MKIDHEYEALKDRIEELHYEGFDSDEIFDYAMDNYEFTTDEVATAITEVEHRVNDVPNEGFYIEEPNPYGN